MVFPSLRSLRDLPSMAAMYVVLACSYVSDVASWMLSRSTVGLVVEVLLRVLLVYLMTWGWTDGSEYESNDEKRRDHKFRRIWPHTRDPVFFHGEIFSLGCYVIWFDSCSFLLGKRSQVEWSWSEVILRMISLSNRSASLLKRVVWAMVSLPVLLNTVICLGHLYYIVISESSFQNCFGEKKKISEHHREALMEEWRSSDVDSFFPGYGFIFSTFWWRCGFIFSTLDLLCRTLCRGFERWWGDGMDVSYVVIWFGLFLFHSMMSNREMELSDRKRSGVAVVSAILRMSATILMWTSWFGLAPALTARMFWTSVFVLTGSVFVFRKGAVELENLADGVRDFFDWFFPSGDRDGAGQRGRVEDPLPQPRPRPISSSSSSSRSSADASGAAGGNHVLQDNLDGSKDPWDEVGASYRQRLQELRADEDVLLREMFLLGREERDRLQCCVCLSRPVCVLFLPCKHVCTCGVCAESLFPTTDREGTIPGVHRVVGATRGISAGSAGGGDDRSAKKCPKCQQGVTHVIGDLFVG